tara:strand:+ start:492 stop:1556 length:1065 start_codon:yes stop_codon:yes gene_type:complete
MASKEEEEKKAAAAKRAVALKQANNAVQASKNASQPNFNIGIDRETAAQYDAAFEPTSTESAPPTSTESAPPIKRYEGTDATDFFEAVDNSIDETVREDEERQQQAQQQAQQLPTRQGIASGLEDLSRRGALTGDLLKQARERATTAGVSEEQFNSFMDKNRIQTSNFTTAAPTSSPQEAAENVAYQREHGTGLGVLAAMQDSNYKVGSGSSLNQPARPVGPKSGRLRSMARRLKKSGNPYWRKAQYDAEQMRLGESPIDTPELRKRRLDMSKRASELARRQDKAYASSADTKLGQSGSGSRGEDVVTSYKPNPSDTLVEGYNKQSRIPKRSFEQYIKELKEVAGDNLDMFGTA